MSSPKSEGSLQEIFIKLCFYRQMTYNAEILILAFEKAGILQSIFSIKYYINWLHCKPEYSSSEKQEHIEEIQLSLYFRSLLYIKFQGWQKEQRHQN